VGIEKYILTGQLAGHLINENYVPTEVGASFQN